jgi:hypothetical protein
MKRKIVRSSNIRSIGYDSKSKTLVIEFLSGGVYQYFNVPESVHNALMTNSSHGSYFHHHIKNKYKWKKIQ